MCRFFVLLLLTINHIGLYYCATRDAVKLELIDNKFRLSVANDPDIKWVTFHVNINKEFNSYEAGQLKGTVGMPRNQLWSFEFDRQLQDDDIIYVWIAIQRNQFVFRDIKDGISVAAFKSGKKDYYVKVGSISTTNTTTTTTTETPTEPTNIANKNSNSLGDGNKQCEETITQIQIPNGRTICKNDLIFEDNFETFNEKLWINEIRIPSTNDIEFVIYNGTLGVEEGILKIDPILTKRNPKKDAVNLGDRCTSFAVITDCMINPTNHLYVPPINSGRINTKKSFNFKYGRVEVRAKLPLGDWLVPLISLEPTNKLYGDMYKSGEMRIAFARGNLDLNYENKNIGADRLFGGAIVSTNAKIRHKYMADVAISKLSQSDTYFADNFHIYSLTWTPNELILSVDDYEYGHVKADFSKLNEGAWSRGAHNAPLDQMFYITLGLSAGGHGDFPNDFPDKPWNNTDPPALLRFNDKRELWAPSWFLHPQLEVDYVKVFAI